jgi:phosphate acetyltransferase
VAAVRAVELAREHKVEALRKGRLHTGEFISPIAGEEKLLLGARRMSHVFLIDTPRYPPPRFVTDAAINITQRSKKKLTSSRNLAQNLLHRFGVERQEYQRPDRCP